MCVCVYVCVCVCVCVGVCVCVCMCVCVYVCVCVGVYTVESHYSHMFTHQQTDDVFQSDDIYMRREFETCQNLLFWNVISTKILFSQCHDNNIDGKFDINQRKQGKPVCTKKFTENTTCVGFHQFTNRVCILNTHLKNYLYIYKQFHLDFIAHARFLLRKRVHINNYICLALWLILMYYSMNRFINLYCNSITYENIYRKANVKRI